MKPITLLFAFLAACGLLNAQSLPAPDSLTANRDLTIENNDDSAAVASIRLADFTAVKISGHINAVIIPVTDVGYLYLKNEAEIKYRIDKNILSIKARSSMVNDKIITVFIGVKNINKLILIGNSRITTRGILPCPELEISCSDNSNCSVNTLAEKIKTTQTPHSKIIISGSYTIHQSSVNGFGDTIIEYVKYARMYESD